ncbi:molybdate ABC transporter substrate-binding protein [Anaeromyxobacter paludicola]|uniref:Molybdate-binding periplasmic protein ModA n=1 Tax=Anaeromyxobacter paludicola TaxID=2918171 RepID=A0ABM7XDI6_9BACT|nr:molybdate ABC transporter substrate-binding protein [Anaeromyxobacter paludicola]BDG09940.1 molybdate-binding periplasmic protein ModA [Anaeromyxobacter paludicola]
MARPLLALALAALLTRPASAAPAGAPPRTLTVAAAANLKAPMADLVAAFEEDRPGVKVRTTFGASANLAAQARAGAPFDLFLSADDLHPRKLAEAGLADAGGPFTYALGRLALWAPAGSPLAVEKEGLAVLASPAVRKVAVANPKLAPYGKAAEEALWAAKLLDAVRPKLVYGESVAQAAQFAESGAADAALLPLSMVLTGPLAPGKRLVLPDDAHPPIDQAGVVLKGARELELAQAFARFVRGGHGQAILARHGYGLPPR